MNKRALLLEEVNHIPEDIVDEVFDFVQFLKKKVSRENIELAIAGESSLKKDWLLPEEDQAWRDL